MKIKGNVDLNVPILKEKCGQIVEIIKGGKGVKFIRSFFKEDGKISLKN